MLKSRTLLLDTALNNIAALQTMYNVNMDLKKISRSNSESFFYLSITVAVYTFDLSLKH